MALGRVIELIEIVTPVGSVRISTARRDIRYMGEVYVGKGIDVVEVRLNQPSGASPGGMSIVITGLTDTFTQQALEDTGWGFETKHHVVNEAADGMLRSIFSLVGRMSETKYQSGNLSADIEPVYSFLLPDNQKYAGYVAPGNLGHYIPRDDESEHYI